MIKNKFVKLLLLGALFIFAFFQLQKSGIEESAISNINNVESPAQTAKAHNINSISPNTDVTAKVNGTNRPTPQKKSILSQAKNTVQDANASNVKSENTKQARLHGHENHNIDPYTNKPRPPGEPKKAEVVSNDQP